MIFDLDFNFIGSYHFWLKNTLFFSSASSVFTSLVSSRNLIGFKRVNNYDRNANQGHAHRFHQKAQQRVTTWKKKQQRMKKVFTFWVANNWWNQRFFSRNFFRQTCLSFTFERATRFYLFHFFLNRWKKEIDKK